MFHGNVSRDNVSSRPYSAGMLRYCHLCDCQIGWLHNATEHWAGEYVPHEPFLEDDCASCWQSLAETTAA